MVVVTFIFAIAAIVVSFFSPDGHLSHLVARIWGRLLIKGAFCKVKICGLEKLKPEESYLFVANHSSSFDIFLLNGYLPYEFRWISKPLYFKVPFLGWGMKKAGYILIYRDKPRQAVKALGNAIEKMKQGFSIAIFPEGTRSRTGTLQPFKKGMIVIAIKANKSIVPITIKNAYKAKPSSGFLVKHCEISILIHDPVMIIKKKEEDECLERIRNTIATGLS